MAELMESQEISEPVDGESEEMWVDTDVSPFLDIPEEMFIHICSFLETKDLVCSLAYVCKRFYALLQDKSIYKSVIALKWGQPYPMVNNVPDDVANWKRGAFFVEKESKHWSVSFKHKVEKTAHLSNADGVMFLNGGQHCVSSSRDQFIVLWNLSENILDDVSPQIVETKKAHEGWVWRLLQKDDYIYTASWDFTIKEWLWQEGFTEKSCMKSNAPVLCLTSDSRGLIYGGSIAKFVQGFDPRAKPDPLFSLEGHRRSVLTLETLNDDVISGSEDKTLIVWDMKMRKPRQRISLGEASYPTSCDKLDNVLYVADNKGSVRAFSYNLGSLKTENTFQEVGHTKLVSTVKVTRGAIVTASLDGTARSHLNLRNPVFIGAVKTDGGEASGMDYCNGKLVIGTASTVEFWIPEL